MSEYDEGSFSYRYVQKFIKDNPDLSEKFSTYFGAPITAYDDEPAESYLDETADTPIEDAIDAFDDAEYIVEKKYFVTDRYGFEHHVTCHEITDAYGRKHQFGSFNEAYNSAPAILAFVEEQRYEAQKRRQAEHRVAVGELASALNRVISKPSEQLRRQKILVGGLLRSYANSRCEAVMNFIETQAFDALPSISRKIITLTAQEEYYYEKRNRDISELIK